MTTDRWRRIESLFHAALARPLSERAAFLTEACGDDTELRSEVESLLAGGDSGQSFMETPVVGSTASLLGRQLGAYRIDAPIGAAAWARSTARRTRGLGAMSP